MMHTQIASASPKSHRKNKWAKDALRRAGGTSLVSKQRNNLRLNPMFVRKGGQTQRDLSWPKKRPKGDRRPNQGRSMCFTSLFAELDVDRWAGLALPPRNQAAPPLFCRGNFCPYFHSATVLAMLVATLVHARATSRLQKPLGSVSLTIN